MIGSSTFIPYPAIEQHGLIGDRRTAALVAADGTLDWLCLPRFDSAPVFGSLLDARKGGFWRIGPEALIMGDQDYLDETGVLITRWRTDGGELELTDLMAWPEHPRAPQIERRRVVLRRIRCVRGSLNAFMQIAPRDDFAHTPTATSEGDRLIFQMKDRSLGLWTSLPLRSDEVESGMIFSLQEGEVHWAALELNDTSQGWSIQKAEEALKNTVATWREALMGEITYTGPRRDRVRRSVVMLHLLTYAPSPAPVAAVTAALPEHIGGSRNWDYRFAWVRDASLILAGLSTLGDIRTPERFMDWIAQLGSSIESPLQPVYGIDGRLDLTPIRRDEIAGYRGSAPVVFGNPADKMLEIDSIGYFADCALIYLQQGGRWKERYWDLIRRVSDYVAENWQKPDSSIWEVAEAHYVTSKVMSWVTLERAIKIAERTGHLEQTDRWKPVMQTIHDEVMARGWSEKRQAFRQRYDTESLDASVLLIPVMGFLPADHPRVTSTVEQLTRSLSIDGLIYRFVPDETPEQKGLLGEIEGAFLMCNFWLATTYAKAGYPEEAEAILARVEAVAGKLGFFSEAIDPRDKTFLGNMPLPFSQVEYLRAVTEIAKAKPLEKAALMVGKAKEKLEQFTKWGKRSAG